MIISYLQPPDWKFEEKIKPQSKVLYHIKSSFKEASKNHIEISDSWIIQIKYEVTPNWQTWYSFSMYTVSFIVTAREISSSYIWFGSFKQSESMNKATLNGLNLMFFLNIYCLFFVLMDSLCIHIFNHYLMRPSETLHHLHIETIEGTHFSEPFDFWVTPHEESIEKKKGFVIAIAETIIHSCKN